MADKQTNEIPVNNDKVKQKRTAKTLIGIGSSVIALSIGAAIATSFGFLIDSIVWPAAALLFVSSGILSFVGVFKFRKANKEKNEITNKQDEQAMENQVTKQEEEIELAKIKEKKKEQTKVMNSSIDTYMFKTSDLNNKKKYFAIYEPNSETIKRDEKNRPLVFEISGDNGYIVQLYKYIMEKEPSDAKVVVCDNEYKKTLYNVHVGEYNKTMLKVLEHINDISNSLRENELVPQL